MSTRRSPSKPSQHGLASDPVYVAAQGIQGTIATKKAGILTSARARSLVFFLQALSLPTLAGRPNPGGLKRWAKEIAKEFPERLGTPAMREFGMKPDQTYKADQVRRIRDEIARETAIGILGVDCVSPKLRRTFPLVGDVENHFSLDDGDFTVPVKNGRTSYPAQVFTDYCREVVEQELPGYIIKLCTEPRWVITAPGENFNSAVVSREEAEHEWGEENYFSPMPPMPISFLDGALDALFEFQRRFAQREAARFAETSIASNVFNTLNSAVRLRRIVMVNGREGIGKSEAARSWCARHLGEARYVDLDGSNNKTSFFSSVARSLGLPASGGLSPSKIQSRIEAVLQLSGLTLVLDEAHYIWPQSERSEATPELVNWIDTALINRGVPVGLVCTPQFVTSMQRVELRTGWNSGQFRRRLKRISMLPDRPTQSDLECVACKCLGKASSSVIKMLVGYAGCQQQHHLDALTDAIKEASELAGGDDKITFAHVKEVIGGILAQTELVKNSIFTERPKPGKRKASLARVANVMQDEGEEDAAPLHETDLAVGSARINQPALPGRKSGELAVI